MNSSDNVWGMRFLTPNQVVAANMRAFRKKRGLSGEQLAEAVNDLIGAKWSKQTVSNLERKGGSRKIDIDELTALARIFRISAIELLLPPTEIPLDDDPKDLEKVQVDVGLAGNPAHQMRLVLDRYEYAQLAFHLPHNAARPGAWDQATSDLIEKLEQERQEFNDWWAHYTERGRQNFARHMRGVGDIKTVPRVEPTEEDKKWLARIQRSQKRPIWGMYPDKYPRVEFIFELPPEDTWEDWADVPNEPPGVLEDWIRELDDEEEDADGEHPQDENQS